MNYTQLKSLVLISLISLVGITISTISNLQTYSHPAWSPNRQLIAFEARKFFSRQKSIFIMKPDGSERRNLTGNLNSREPVWAPDGEKVAFICSPYKDFPNQTEICVAGINNSKPIQLTYNSSSLNPTWSPDGKRIAFTSHQNNVKQIFVIDINNSEVTTKLIDAPIPQELPSWSPDGNKIAFVSQTSVNIVKIFVVNINNKTIQFVGEGIFPTWSPDSNKIAFTNGRIHVVNPDGSQLIQLSQTGALASDSRPVWSNDGKKIAFFSPTFTPIDSSASIDTKIYIVASDGSEPPKYLTNGASPTWSVDSKKIAFELGGRLLMINVNTSKIDYLN